MCDNRCSIETEHPGKKYTEFLREKPKINTSELYETLNIPKRFECSYLFKGYGYQREENHHPFYKTVNSEYGYYPPNPHTVPTRFFPRGQKFSNKLTRYGMYRNRSLNTIMDKTFF